MVTRLAAAVRVAVMAGDFHSEPSAAGRDTGLLSRKMARRSTSSSHLDVFFGGDEEFVVVD